jgi:hypothetical protein
MSYFFSSYVLVVRVRDTYYVTRHHPVNFLLGFPYVLSYR